MQHLKHAMISSAGMCPGFQFASRREQGQGQAGLPRFLGVQMLSVALSMELKGKTVLLGGLPYWCCFIFDLFYIIGAFILSGFLGDHTREGS